jgi:hypothetical protein
MKTLTIRNVPRRLAEALEREKRRTGTSLNGTVIDLLARALGVGGHAPRRNGLASLAGGWSAEEHRQFEEAMSAFERVDEEMWS